MSFLGNFLGKYLGSFFGSQGEAAPAKMAEPISLYSHRQEIILTSSQEPINMISSLRPIVLKETKCLS